MRRAPGLIAILAPACADDADSAPGAAGPSGEGRSTYRADRREPRCFGPLRVED